MTLEEKWKLASKGLSDNFEMMESFGKLYPNDKQELINVINEGRKKKKRKPISMSRKSWDRWTVPAFQLQAPYEQSSNLPSDGGEMMGENKKELSKNQVLFESASRYLD
jgi:hypothetical protein